jgi:predicted ATPase/DNA-binding winged helix-turn-helix (wHTH) protein
MDRLDLETCTVDIVRRVVRGAEGLVRLSPMEAKLLDYLASRPGMTVVREELLREVWGYREGVVSRTLDTTVRTLRAKIEADRTTPSHVLTDPGGGYRFEGARVIAPPPPAAPPPIPLAAVQEHNQFVGRVDDLAAVESKLVAGARLVTVLGVAGVGKTRFAKRVVRNLLARGRFSGGIRVVDLMAASTPDDALHAVALAMHSEGAPRLNTDAIGAHIASMGPMLIVLDNVDSVVDAVARLVAVWMDTAPDLRVLVTSRERLRLRAEQCHALEPLSPDESVALLRARAEAGGLVLDAQGEAFLVDLSRRLEGLPLGLELAAARLPALGPRGVLERLAHGFSFLGDESRDLPVRHTSLHTAIQASWDLLPSWARDAWMQTSVFIGGFDLASATAVIDLSRYTNAPTIDAVLDMLAERCLIRRTSNTEVRFGAYESLRSFARKRLDLAERRAAVELRHGTWFLRMAEPLTLPVGSHTEPVWYTLTTRPQARLEVERSNLLAAWTTLAMRGPPDHAARLAIALFTGGLAFPLHTRIEYAEQVRGRIDQMSKNWRCRMYLLLAALRIACGLDEEAWPDLRRAFELAVETSDLIVQAEALDLRARVHRQSGELATALADAEAALHLISEAHDPLRRAILLVGLGTTRLESAWTSLSASHGAAAEDAFTRALALFRRARSNEGQGWALARLALLLTTQDRLDEARVCADDAVRLTGAVIGTPRHTEALLLRGYVTGAEGDEAEAQASLRLAWETAAPFGDRRSAFAAAAGLAALHLASEDAHAALAELEKADILLQGIGMAREQAIGSLLRGLAECLAGRPTSAVASLVGAEESTGADSRTAATALGVTAWAHLALGRTQMARAAATEARARTARGSAEERLATLVDGTSAWVTSSPGTNREDARRKLDLLLATIDGPRPRTLDAPDVAICVIRGLVERLLRGKPSAA